ncbi:epimerase [Thalassococcus sp. CAU 1522]|uniref:Epimerase n=1 Tax=Thalassococcus arenae TaxID=2851652 RepID=A0ABS6N611_9RHOB|nr:epimerase [Thalassococcus arenae]MBV2359233.1 epimerase [Thalassococcus arenae]
MTGTVLILGGAGRFGKHAAEAFWNAGWRIRLFDRSRDDLTSASDGAEVIVNAWNPPYADWARTLPSLTGRVISAAKGTGATVLIPGNVYNFGAEAKDLFGSGTPHAATNPLGRLRAEMEAAYRAAGVRTIVLRAGDFLDTEASGNWFDKVMAPSLGRGVLTYPGDPDAAHAWAWLPDMARAAELLARRRRNLPAFVDVPFPGYTLTARQMANVLSRSLNRPVRVKRMNWLPIHLAQPVWPTARHLLEMRYLWSKPHRLDPALLNDLLPAFAATDPEDALGQAAMAAMRAARECAGRPRRVCAARFRLRHS